jgi:hypothetical protein
MEKQQKPLLRGKNCWILLFCQPNLETRIVRNKVFISKKEGSIPHESMTFKAQENHTKGFRVWHFRRQRVFRVWSSRR